MCVRQLVTNYSMMAYSLLGALLLLLAGKYLVYLHKHLHFYVTGCLEALYGTLKWYFGPMSQQPDLRIQPVVSSLLSKMCACPVRAVLAMTNQEQAVPKQAVLSWVLWKIWHVQPEFRFSSKWAEEQILIYFILQQESNENCVDRTALIW